MSKETGGPAFPQALLNDEGEVYYFHDWHGMSLRDYFAAEAMHVVMPPVLEEVRRLNISDADVTKLKRVSAEACYGMADAMMEARK